MSGCNLISGVTVFSSGNIGPRVGIMAITHGDEPAGVFAHNFLLDFFSRNSLTLGELYLIEGNPEAAKKGFICIEENLNRLFQEDSLLTEKQKKSKEYKRSRELMPILASLDFLLDIHSTNNPGPVFSILKKIDAPHIDLASILPVEFYSLGWGNMIQGTTCDWIDSYNGVGITIECGEHSNPQGGIIAIESAKIFIQETGLYDFGIPCKRQTKWLEVVKKEKITDKDSFCYSKEYKNFESIGRGELIAIDNKKEYRASESDGNVIIFPTNIDSIRSGAIQEAYLLGIFKKNVN